MTSEMRKLCEDAGIPAAEIARIETATAGFIDEDLRMRSVQMLIDAWKRDRR